MTIQVIAEAGVNHNGSLERALEMIDVAADAGADVVKFQTFKAEKLVTAAARKATYQATATGSDDGQLAMLKALELSVDDHHRLAERCRARGITFLSTPFDSESLDFLVNRIGMETVKIPSGEITNGPLLLAVARTRRRIILSTGMSDLAEVAAALSVLAFGLTDDGEPRPDDIRAAHQSPAGQAALCNAVTLLHCTTEYPAPVDQVNLRAMDTLRSTFGLPVGLSDHTAGTAVAIAAAARGATVIEKHFTLDRTLPGPDHAASLEPRELAQMIDGIRDAERAIGNGEKVATPAEIPNRPIARKSLVAARPIAAGQILTADDLNAKRPGDGISPMAYWRLLGKPANRAYETDEPIDAQMDGT